MAQINIPTSGVWAAIASALNSMFSDIFGRTGWASYVDTQYVAGNELSIAGDTDVNLPNNKLSLIESQKPTDVTTFYDGSVITGRNGDDIILGLQFTITPTNISTTLVEVWIDITGGTGTPDNLANLYRTPFDFPRGQGVPRNIVFTRSGYTLDTWEANGGVVKIRTNGTATIRDVSYIIKRTHKAR